MLAYFARLVGKKAQDAAPGTNEPTGISRPGGRGAAQVHQKNGRWFTRLTRADFPLRALTVLTCALFAILASDGHCRTSTPSFALWPFLAVPAPPAVNWQWIHMYSAASLEERLIVAFHCAITTCEEHICTLRRHC
jgi:hypothetical protein